MTEITDQLGREIGYLAYDLVDGETSDAIVLRVTAQPDRVFKSGPATSVLLKARIHGSGGPYQSLAGGFDLSAYEPGEIVQFDLTATGSVATGRAREAVFVGVVDTPIAAGWQPPSPEAGWLAIQDDDRGTQYAWVNTETGEFAGFKDTLIFSGHIGVKIMSGFGSVFRRGTSGVLAFQSPLPTPSKVFLAKWDTGSGVGSVRMVFGVGASIERSTDGIHSIVVAEGFAPKTYAVDDSDLSDSLPPPLS